MNDGGPVFPRTVHTTTTLKYETAPFGEEAERQIPISYDEPGMSLRDWFAGHAQVPDELGWAAEALMGEPPPQWSSPNDYDNSIKCAKWWATARARYRLMEADAMLAERDKQ